MGIYDIGSAESHVLLALVTVSEVSLNGMYVPYLNRHASECLHLTW